MEAGEIDGLDAVGGGEERGGLADVGGVGAALAAGGKEKEQGEAKTKYGGLSATARMCNAGRKDGGCGWVVECTPP